MAVEREEGLAALEQAQAFAQTYRFEMTDEYRALIVRVEAMPRNQSGADKTGRWLGSHADLNAFVNAFTPVPRP